MSESSRQEINAQDFFNNQKKKSILTERRPVPRNGTDIGLGPGLAESAVRITNFNDLLATFDGYYSAIAGALNAPNATDVFVGTTVMDSLLGGVQRFSPLIANSTVYYTRAFLRNPSDASSITWGNWVKVDPSVSPLMPNVQAFVIAYTASVPNNLFTTLKPPTSSFSTNADGTFLYTTTAWQILRPGIYLVAAQIGNLAGASMRTRISINGVTYAEPVGSPYEFPGYRQVQIAVTAASLASGNASIFLQAYQSTGAALSSSAAYQLQLTRLGDA